MHVHLVLSLAIHAHSKAVLHSGNFALGWWRIASDGAACCSSTVAPAHPSLASHCGTNTRNDTPLYIRTGQRIPSISPDMCRAVIRRNSAL